MWEPIKEQFKQVITYSQGIANPQVDNLFEEWYKAKKKFIDRFNGLIYCHPVKVSFSLDTEIKQKKVRDFINTVASCFNNDDLAYFIDKNQDNFYNNLTEVDYYLSDDEVIKKGTKIIKAFRYFEKDKKILSILQDSASRILQEDKVEGYLCVSVHPLDFLSISENTHNWRSCHALDGDYRAGNLNYMVDETTVVCYLRSENNDILPNFPFPWTNKKWRVLLYDSNDDNMIIAGRQYPFNSSQAMERVRELILPLITNCEEWDPWDDSCINNVNNKHFLNKKYYPSFGELKPLDEFVKDGEGSLQFNDVLKSSYYKPMYSFPKKFWLRTRNNTHFTIGKRVKCLCCGEDSITLGCIMRCIECEEVYGNTNDDVFGYCDCCGRHIYLEDSVVVNDYDILCQQCADNQTTNCECCNEIVYNDEIVYNRTLEQYVCRRCDEGVQEGRFSYGI